MRCTPASSVLQARGKPSIEMPMIRRRRPVRVLGLVIVLAVAWVRPFAAMADEVAQASRSVTGPCSGVLHWLRQEGEEGWLRRCRASAGGRDSMTYGGATHSCHAWIAICRNDPGYHGGPVRSR